MKDFYAIEKVGYRYYVIKAVFNDDLIPVSDIAHRTLEAAKAEAARLGFEVQSVGDMYNILADFQCQTAP